MSEEILLNNPYITRSLKAMHEPLKDNYTNEDGTPAQCGLIAIRIAGLCLDQGFRPHLLGLRGKLDNSPGILRNQSLKPRRYNGRVIWGGHTVCAVGDIILDPLVGRLMQFEEYTKEAFSDEVISRIQISQEDIEEFVAWQ